MEVIKHLAKNASRAKLGRITDNIRTGWNNYSFLFYIGGVSAILGSLFGLAGWASILFTLVFFFYAGEFKKLMEEERKKYWSK